MSKGIIEFSIKNFRGIVALSAKPNGKSVTVRGKNGAGKSSTIDALWWALGGNLDGEVVRNGADRAEVELRFGDYLVRRQQGRGKKPTLEVKSADGKAKFASPTALLAGFVGAIERRTFSARGPKERAEVLRRLAPGLDCADLDGERARVYEERTGINRDARTLRAQAEGVVVPPAPEVVAEERTIVDVVDVAAVAAKKGEVEKQRAANAVARAAASTLQRQAESAASAERAAMEKLSELRRQIADAEAALEQRSREAIAAQERAMRATQDAAALIDPDTSAIDAEIAAAKQENATARAAAEAHNRAVRAARQAQADHQRALADRARIEKQAAEREAAAAKLTARLEQIDADKAARLAAAALPIPGIALAGDVVTFDDGKAGPVELEALNTAARIRLDVAIAAALGHRLIAVRDASLLDAEQRAEIDRFAADHGVQLLAEVVASGEPLTAEIIEAPPLDPQTQGELGDDF